MTIALGLGTAASAAPLAERAVQPAFLLLAAITAVFAWGAFAGIARHPYGALFKALIRPRLGAPAYLEEPEPPPLLSLWVFWSPLPEWSSTSSESPTDWSVPQRSPSSQHF